MIEPTLAGALAAVATDALHALQGETAPSLRPYVHVFLAYGVAWILILVWVWRIARSLRGLARTRPPDPSHRE